MDVFRKRYEELSLYEASDDEKKHVEHELHALSELINTIEPFKKHRFLGVARHFIVFSALTHYTRKLLLP